MAGARRDLNRELELTPRRCELGDRFRSAGIDSGCGGRATCWHELRKRSGAGSIVNRANCLASCVPCNHYVENHEDEARAAGLVLRPGDEDWEDMSVRRDRE